MGFSFSFKRWQVFIFGAQVNGGTVFLTQTGKCSGGHFIFGKVDYLDDDCLEKVDLC